jgi:hypothetical protein
LVHAPDLGLPLDVADALAALAPGDRRVAWLLSDDTVAGVARQTGMSRGRVRGARTRIARRLAEYFSEDV